MNSTTPGGESSSFDSLDVTLPDVDDDLEVVFDDADLNASPASVPARGQNEGDGDFDDEPDYSDPRFQERLQREVQLREQDAAAALEERERIEYALLNSEKTKIVTQRDSFKLALDGIDVRIATTTEALKYAKQEGDTSAEVDLQIQLQHFNNIRASINENMGKLPNESSLDAQFRDHINRRRSEFQQRRSQAAGADAPRALNEKAGSWTKANTWMADPARAKEKSALMEVNNALAAEGYDPQSDEFFTELSRRLAKRFPTLPVKTLGGNSMGNGSQGRPQGQRSAPPVAPARSSAPPGPNARNRSRVSLDSNDVALMKMFRIDPNDEVARKRYAAEKFRRVQAEQRR